MTCQKCGANLNTNAQFCKFCGTKVSNTSCQYGDNISNSAYDSTSCHTQQYNYSYNYSNKTTPKYDLNASHQEQYDYSNKFNYLKSSSVYASSEDVYLENYVGSNYNIIKNKKFSFSTLLFGEIYLIYRKLWFQAFTCFLFSLLSLIYIKGDYALIAIAVIRMFYALKFSETYMNTAERRVEQIKQSNLDKSSQELLQYCKKKGQPIAAIPVIVIFGIIIAIMLLTAFSESEYTNETNDQYTENESTNQTLPSSISFRLPAGFTEEYNSDTIKNYIYKVPNSYTECRITTWRYPTTIYPNEESFINDKIKSFTQTENNTIIPIYINTKSWKYSTTETSGHKMTLYAINHNNQIYGFETSNLATNSYDDSICRQKYTTFINSIKIN